MGHRRDRRVSLFFCYLQRSKPRFHSMLFTRVPKYEELKVTEQELYHFDKDIYNESARKGGKSLYFAKSGTSGETWVPLIEKAYAKLHGNYSHLIGGQECDAIEDLTG